MELSKNTVGRIIGNNEGIWRIAILSRILNSIFLLELLLISSIKSIEIKRKHEKVRIMANEIKFSLNKYFKIIRLFSITVFLTFSSEKSMKLNRITLGKNLTLPYPDI